MQWNRIQFVNHFLIHMWPQVNWTVLWLELRCLTCDKQVTGSQVEVTFLSSHISQKVNTHKWKKKYRNSSETQGYDKLHVWQGTALWAWFVLFFVRFLHLTRTAYCAENLKMKRGQEEDKSRRVRPKTICSWWAAECRCRCLRVQLEIDSLLSCLLNSLIKSTKMRKSDVSLFNRLPVQQAKRIWFIS